MRLRLRCKEWLTELININYVLGMENEDELGLTCQLGKCSFYNKGLRLSMRIFVLKEG
jgi:hypothetical protein